MQARREDITQRIKTLATQAGFDACGIARAGRVEPTHESALNQWLQQKGHGSMSWMTRNHELRLDPEQLHPKTKSVVCLAMNYYQQDYQPKGSHYRISRYAAGADYHGVIKAKLYAMIEQLNPLFPDGVSARVFTDSAPVMERYWAQKAGLGSPGKNACLILPSKGSFFFLAEIFIDQELVYDEPYTRDLCGKCTRCIDACPTGAIQAPGKVHAPLCISYLTIESKEPVPEDLQPQLNNYIFGCDICQDVCPHNLKFATKTIIPEFEPLDAIRQWKKSDWEQLDKASFRKHLQKKNSPLARAGFSKLVLNIQAISAKH